MRRGRPGALGGERADVQLVIHVAALLHALALAVSPRERRIDDLRWTEGTLRLEARRRVGVWRVVACQREPIAGPRPQAGHQAAPVALLGIPGQGGAAL